MNIEAFRMHCIAKLGVTEELPFDNNTLVFKVMGKMFALTGVDTFDSINLKCNPELAIELREQYDEVTPGYHMNKKHWNSVSMMGRLSDGQIKEWVDHSYDLVVKGLTKKLREELEEMNSFL